jgi:hypothetical protein
MALTFTTTGASQDGGVKCLVYGGSGVGKTVLCGTAPTPVILSAENGLLSLRHKNIPVVLVKTLADVTDAYNWCATSKEAAQFATVCLDSISEIAEVCLAGLKAKYKDPRLAYGELFDLIASVIRSFRDLPNRNVVITAQQESMQDDTQHTVFGPSLPGAKFSPKVPYFFDEVFCLQIGKLANGAQYRFLQTGASIQHVAKDRSGILAYQEEPDLTKLYDKIKGQ